MAMYFTYNDIQIGNQTDCHIQGHPLQQWKYDEYQFMCIFKKQFSSNEDYVDTLNTWFDETDGLTVPHRAFVIYRDSDDADHALSFDPTGTLANTITGMRHVPMVEEVGEPTDNGRYRTFKFQITVQLTNASTNRFESLSVQTGRDIKGEEDIVISGYIPKRYLNGTSTGSLEIWDKQISSLVDVVLNTFGGKEHYKVVSGPSANSGSHNSLGSLNSDSDIWQTGHFQIGLQQVFVKEGADEDISSLFVTPSLQLTYAGTMVHHKYSPGIAFSGDKISVSSINNGFGEDLNKDSYSFSWNCLLRVDSSYLKGTKERQKKFKEKASFLQTKKMWSAIQDHIWKKITLEIKNIFQIQESDFYFTTLNKHLNIFEPSIQVQGTFVVAYRFDIIEVKDSVSCNIAYFNPIPIANKEGITKYIFSTKGFPQGQLQVTRSAKVLKPDFSLSSPAVSSNWALQSASVQATQTNEVEYIVPESIHKKYKKNKYYTITRSYNYIWYKEKIDEFGSSGSGKNLNIQTPK